MDAENPVESERKLVASDEQHGKRKVLIGAFSCLPDRGSEPAVGWNWAVQAARTHNVWVLAYPEDKSAIDRYLAEHSDLSITFVYWEVPWWPSRLLPPERMWQIYYPLWQITSYSVARRLHREVHFDVVHQLTFITVEAPGFLWLLDAPFIWGPVGGAQGPPAVLRRYFGGGWVNQMLRMFRKRIVPFNPLVRLAIRKARTLLAANEDTENLLRKSGARHVVREKENAVHIPIAVESISDRSGDSLQVIWAGILEPRKAPELALEIVAEVRRRGVPIELTIVGDGSLADAVDRRIAELALDDIVFRLGRVSHSRMNAIYQSANVFLFTSLQDTSGTVVLEAMANGVPVVALDHHGASDVVTSETGFKITPRAPEQTIADFASAIVKLYEDPELRAVKGQAAWRRTEQYYTWDRKEELIRKLYSQEGLQSE